MKTLKKKKKGWKEVCSVICPFLVAVNKCAWNASQDFSHTFDASSSSCAVWWNSFVKDAFISSEPKGPMSGNQTVAISFFSPVCLLLT